MAGPWEQYQTDQPAGPWAKYKSEADAISAPAKDEGGGWGRFLATAGTEAATGLADFAANQVIAPFQTPSDYRKSVETGQPNPNLNPFTRAGTQALEKAGMLYKPTSGAGKVGLAATEGAMQGATAGPVGAALGGAAGGAGAAVMQVVPDRWKAEVGAALPLVLSVFARGKGATADEAAVAQAGQILTKAGIPKDQHAQIIEAAKAQAAPDFERSGAALKQAGSQAALKTAARSEAGDASKLEAAKAQRLASIDQTKKALASTRGNVDQIAQQGLKQIDRASALVEPGNFPKDAAAVIRDTKNQLSNYFSTKYTAAENKAGQTPVDISPMSESAKEFLGQLPEDLKSQFPAVIKQLQGMGSEGPASMTLGQLHYLRSQLSDMAYNPSLAGNFKKFPYQQMKSTVDSVINSAENAPNVRAGAKLLRDTDREYAAKMRPFNSAAWQSVVKNMQAGFPENSHVAMTLFKENNGGALGKLLQIGGPDFERQMQGAVLRDSLSDAKMAVPNGNQGYYDPSIMLKNMTDNQTAWNRLYGADRVKEWQTALARAAMKDDQLPANVKLDPDGFTRLLDRQKILEDRLEKLVKSDPAKALADGVKAGDHPLGDLGFLTGNITAHAAATRILGDTGLTQKAIQQFGQNHPAIQTLRQEAIQNLLAPMFKGTPGQMGTRVGAMKTEVLNQLFPAEAANDLRTIAAAMERDAAASSAEKNSAKWIAHIIGHGLGSMALRTGGPQIIHQIARGLTVKPENLPRVKATLMAIGQQNASKIENQEDQ